MDVMDEIRADLKEISKKVPDKKHSNRNEIMIKRVIKALCTDDPDVIAKKITSSTNILNQTDFSNYDDVIDYMKHRGKDL